MLGLRNLTWQDVEKYASVKPSGVASVPYGKAPPASETTRTAASQPSDPQAPATEAQVKAIHAIANKLGITDELAKAQKAQQILGLEAAPTSMSKLSKGQASDVIGKLQEEVQAQGGGE